MGNLKPACAPTSRMSRLTTVASTGRLMKMSVKRIGLLLRQLSRSFYRARIVDLDGGARLQFELAAAHHLLSCGDAFEDGDPVALGRPDAHKTALDIKLRLGRDSAGRSRIGGCRRHDRLGRRSRSWRRRGLRRALLNYPHSGRVTAAGGLACTA